MKKATWTVNKICHFALQYIHSADIIHRVSINPEITSCNELMCLKNVTQNLTLQNQEEIF